MPQTSEERYTIVRNAIQKGQLDEFLDELAMAVNNRRQTANIQASYRLVEGDFIILPANTKPKMLSRQIVIFEGRDATRLRVRLTQTYSSRWQKDSIIRIPATMVGKVVKHRDGLHLQSHPSLNRES
jgi:hypothetical protein